MFYVHTIHVRIRLNCYFRSLPRLWIQCEESRRRAWLHYGAWIHHIEVFTDNRDQYIAHIDNVSDFKTRCFKTLLRASILPMNIITLFREAKAFDTFWGYVESHSAISSIKWQTKMTNFTLLARIPRWHSKLFRFCVMNPIIIRKWKKRYGLRDNPS